jgi:hypothetical protein
MTELVVPSALELVGNLVHGLDRSRILAIDLAADLDIRNGLALERDLAGVISNARALAHDLADARDLARVICGDRDLANALGSACASGRDLAVDLAAARARDRATRGDPFDPSLTFDLAMAGTRAYAAARDWGRATASSIAKDLIIARDLANGIASDLNVRDLTSAADRDSEGRDEDEARPARPAARVAWTAACLLPRRDRTRYDLEYRSELTDLATAGVGRVQQLRHAARLLVRAPMLRVELAIARRRVAR